METQNSINHNGETVFFSVSPCSWMNKNYGLQVCFSLKETGCNAESEFILDKQFEATGKPLSQLDEVAKLMVKEWLNANGTDQLHAKLEKWQQAKIDFEAEIAEDNERVLDEQRRDDSRYKAKGFTHRVNAMIHPSAGGDDYETVAYFVGKPTQSQVDGLLQMSAVKEDFVVREI